MWRVLAAVLCLAMPAPALARCLAAPLPLMLALRARGEARAEWDWILPSIARDEVGLTLRLRAEPDRDLIARLERAGVALRRDRAGRLVHLGPLYSATVPWDAVERLASFPEVERAELARPPGLRPHLDVSVPEVGAPELWALEDGRGAALDGTGVLAADFDSGIDVFHPLLFFADGGVFDWIDVDGDGRLVPGVDAVDLDGDGVAGPGEALGLLEGALVQGGQGWVDGFFDHDVDWLYNDADGDGERSRGPEAGYTDLDPSFGELLLVALDENGDGRIGPGERLVGLGTSKLVATLVWPDRIRYRGVDLIETPVVDALYERRYGRDDRADHGTGVCSVLAGGWAGLGRRITGVAPGAELVLVDFANEMGLAATLPWVISLGARVGAHPYGHKIFSFLDGSSNEELAIDLAHEAHDVPQVVSVGNEALHRDDATAEVPPLGAGPLSMPFTLTNYDWSSREIALVALTVRWRRPDSRLVFRLIDPEGRSVDLGAGGGAASVGDAAVDSSREDSTRGTAKLDLVLTRAAGLPAGEWRLEVEGDLDEAVPVTATLLNDLFRGGMGTSFADPEQVDPMATVSALATADRALGACSYGTRQSSRGELVGDISGFSSRGPRIDGLRLVDICAPGDNDIVWAQAGRHGIPGGAYSFGGGTSASAPHVAGALALLAQAAPWARALELEDALLGGALADGWVGEAPNDTWGFGKLRVGDALALLPAEPPERDEREPDLAPWDRGLTPVAEAAPEAPEGLLFGVEGGGCHCTAAGGRRWAGAGWPARLLLSHLTRTTISSRLRARSPHGARHEARGVFPTGRSTGAQHREGEP